MRSTTAPLSPLAVATGEVRLGVPKKKIIPAGLANPTGMKPLRPGLHTGWRWKAERLTLARLRLRFAGFHPGKPDGSARPKPIQGTLPLFYQGRTRWSTTG